MEEPEPMDVDAGPESTATTAPDHSTTAGRTKSVIESSLQEIHQNFLMHLGLGLYLMPSARSQLIDRLVSHTVSTDLNSGVDSEKVKAQLTDLVYTQMLPAWSPVIEVLDKGLIIIDNEFDSETCLNPEQIPGLITRAKQFASRRFASHGDKLLESTYENCWKIIGRLVNQRNQLISKHEQELKKHAIELVHELYDFGDQTEAYKTALQGKMSESYRLLVKSFGEKKKSNRRTKAPKPAPLPPRPLSMMENQRSNSQAMAMDASNCAALTKSKIPDPESEIRYSKCVKSKVLPVISG